MASARRRNRTNIRVTRLKHNPRWSHADLTGRVPTVPQWADGHFRLHAMFVFDEHLPFTRDSWRGRFRACRAIGATLTPEQTDAFDREHDAQSLLIFDPETGEWVGGITPAG